MKFKYSVGRILIGMGIGSALAVIGGLVLFYLSKYFEKQRRAQMIENFRNDIFVLPRESLWEIIVQLIPIIIALIGILVMTYAVACFARKRVFLCLTKSELQHNELDFFRITRIPYIKETFISWDNIAKINITPRFPFGRNIRLTLHEKKKDKNRIHDISVLYCEQTPEQVIRAIESFRTTNLSKDHKFKRLQT